MGSDLAVNYVKKKKKIIKAIGLVELHGVYLKA